MAPGQILLRAGQLPGRRVIPHPGGVGLLPLLRQLFIHLPYHVVEEGGQAPALQPVHIRLLLPHGFFQLLRPGGVGIPLAPQLRGRGLQFPLAGALGEQLLQLLVIAVHLVSLLSLPKASILSAKEGFTQL